MHIYKKGDYVILDDGRFMLVKELIGDVLLVVSDETGELICNIDCIERLATSEEITMEKL